MREKQFLVIKIVDKGIRPLRLNYSEVEELLEMDDHEGVREFIKNSVPGEDLEFKSGFIIHSAG